MLLDTSRLLCLHNRAEPFHAHARMLYRAARIRLTHSGVLAEFIVLALLIARQDKTYSLCDALSFVLMRQRHLTEALITDRHFEQECKDLICSRPPHTVPYEPQEEIAPRAACAPAPARGGAG